MTTPFGKLLLTRLCMQMLGYTKWAVKEPYMHTGLIRYTPQIFGSCIISSKTTSCKGMDMFAARDLEAGTLATFLRSSRCIWRSALSVYWPLVVDTCVVSYFIEEVSVAEVQLDPDQRSVTEEQVQRALTNSRPNNRPNSSRSMKRTRSAIKSKIVRIHESNAFGDGQSGGRTLIALEVLRINHSCVPNADTVAALVNGQVVKYIYTNQAVAKGDELFVSYGGDWYERTSALRWNNHLMYCYGFTCEFPAIPTHHQQYSTICPGFKRTKSQYFGISSQDSTRPIC